MLDRVIAELMLWGVRGGLAWLVAHETALIAAGKLNEVARAGQDVTPRPAFPSIALFDLPSIPDQRRTTSCRPASGIAR